MRERRRPKRGKGGKINQEAVFRLKAVLTIAGARLLKHSIQCFKEALEPNTKIFLNEISVQTSCRDPLRLDNEGR